MDRWCKCACGGTLSAASDKEIERAVRLHNSSPTHRRWRERGGFYPTVVNGPAALFTRALTEQERTDT